MRTETPPKVRMQDYRPFPWRILGVRLAFTLDPDVTVVRAVLQVRATGRTVAPLHLDGEKLNLRRIAIDGRELRGDEYALGAEGLVIHRPDPAFELEIITEIAPRKNTELSGLYMSGGRFCTQCEAEGFRRITFYPDRPDVLAPFDVRIEADRMLFPTLLSNGNPGASGQLEGGRHFAEWSDPHPKPSYLFALVGGEFDVLTEDFTTASQRPVKLSIFVDKGDAGFASYAMQSLRRAMRWDEDVFGREYDLDVFNIVAVRDFNFGAMENKGLNIFNSAYVLADGDTATDADFEAIESIVAHEYFHNWTGNRITCRDWFQLCLKEGLTVYRDQEFTHDMRSAAVARIKDVIRLRQRQFPEDSGPLAHPVRPDSYGRIDNLYTATVYEKGAELIRMLRLMIGENAFFAGINRYFDENDGRAATIEDFIRAFQKSTTHDLAAFAGWYAQAGTPNVTARGEYNARSRTFTLHLSQHTPPTPGEPHKRALPIPLRAALFAPGKGRLSASLENGPVADEHLLILTAQTASWRFTGVETAPLVSLNRGFSAPVRLVDDLSEPQRATLAGMDDDPFNQWEGLQRIARALILDAAARGGAAPDPARMATYLDALESALGRASSDDAFAALLLLTPTVGELILDMPQSNPSALHASRKVLREAMAKRVRDQLVRAASRAEPARFSASAAAVGRRALKSAALSLLSALGPSSEDVILAAFADARTMTERLACLAALSGIETPAFDRALAEFEGQWAGSPLVMDKWFGVQAAAVRDDIRSRLDMLAARPDYDLRNPNRVRALAAAFAVNNPVSFHAADGWGYRFLCDIILKVDPLNPALSARLATSFESWRAFDAPRRREAEAQLRRLADSELSRNAQDIVGRALARPDESENRP